MLQRDLLLFVITFGSLRRFAKKKSTAFQPARLVIITMSSEWTGKHVDVRPCHNRHVI